MGNEGPSCQRLHGSARLLLDRRHVVLSVLLILCGPASAQNMKPADMNAEEAARRRFPQPVRVGDLIGRRVLQPVESQPVLGSVDRLVRRPDASVDVIVRYGGLLARYGGVFGFGSRPIAVPLTAMVVLGEYVEVADFTPTQLDGFPTDDGAGATSLQGDDMVPIGLARPSH